MAGWIAEIAREQPRICFTAVDADDTPMGHVQFLHDPTKKWARLGRFAVARYRRGEGFGRTLFDHAVRFAFTELGVDHLALAVVPENRIAHGMYARSGFVDEKQERSVRADGVSYEVNIMGLSRADWTSLIGARDDAAKVA
jgi:RimJ/RimL family protein N-acetyltransferase